MDLTRKRICVTGGAGLLGRGVCARLRSMGVDEQNLFVPRRAQYDLTQEPDVIRMYDEHRPEVVIHLAAEVGGIEANLRHPGHFFFANLSMGLHLVEHARRTGAQKFVHTATVCSYPKMCPVPFREDDLWQGYPEESNAPYGIAKKAIIIMLDAYYREYGLKSAVLVPSNLYGPGDNFDPGTSHVIPALIRKFYDARQSGQPSVEVWGTGQATRDFLYVDDAAAGVVQAAQLVDEPTPINLGTGRETLIRDLVTLIADRCGYSGTVEWNASKPDGQPRRVVDTRRAQELLNWEAQVTLQQGVETTIAWWQRTCGEMTAS